MLEIFPSWMQLSQHTYILNPFLIEDLLNEHLVQFESFKDNYMIKYKEK